MPIEIQHLKERVAGLKNTFSTVRNDLSDIHGSVRDMYADYQKQNDRLGRVLDKMTVFIQESRAASDPAPRGAGNQPADLENPRP